MASRDGDVWLRIPATIETGALPRNESATAADLGPRAACRGLLDACADHDGAGLAMVVAGTSGPCRQRPAVVGAGLRTAAVRCRLGDRSEEHTSELQSLMRISYAVFCLKNKKTASNASARHDPYPSQSQLNTVYTLHDTPALL